MRYYPSFSDVFDDLFDSGVNTTKANTMLCDIRETENTYVMNIALPGYKKEDIALEKYQHLLRKKKQLDVL